MIIIDQDTLQGGLGFYEDGGDFAGFHGILLADIDDIPIEDPGVDHAVTFAGEGEVGMNVGRDIDIVLDVFICQDWRATGNGADEGDFPHLRHGHDVGGKNWVNGEEEIRLDIQSPTKVLDGIWVWHILVIFPITNRIMSSVNLDS